MINSTEHGDKMRTSRFLGLTATATAATLAFSAYAQETRTIGISFPNAGQPVVETLLGYAQAKASTMGFQIVVDDPGNDLTKQFSTLDTWIESGAVDVIVSTIPNSPDVFNSVAGRAKDAGIPWISYAASIDAEAS